MSIKHLILLKRIAMRAARNLGAAIAWLMSFGRSEAVAVRLVAMARCA